MESMQIVHLATRCTTLFKEHSQSYGISSTEGLESVKQIMETQSARLNLWADNNGVFARGNASLDARLQDHSDIQLLVVGQLQSLLRHLGRMATHKGSEKDHSAIIAVEHEYDDGNSSSALSMSSFSTMSSGALTSRTGRTRSIDNVSMEEVPPLVAIIHALDRLHRVAMAIRRSGMTSHNSKAAVEQFFDEENKDVVEVFRNWCLELLRHKFKSADARLLEIIAHASAERRRRFMYRKKHQRKLLGHGGTTATAEKRTLSESKDPRAPFSRTPSRLFDHTTPGSRMGPRTAIQNSIARFSQTTASKIARDSFHYEPSVQTTIFSASPSTQVLVDSSMYPPAPKVPAGAAEFYCPYCCRVHPAVERSGKRWRQHFLRDLSPFICLVDNCITPDKLYPDQHTWLRHMESHSIKYTCQHHPKPVRFDNEVDFDHHILNEHQQLTSTRLASLRSFNSSSSRLDICNCPICGFYPTKALRPGQSVANDDLAYKELTTHIANDLHYIAMWSLDEGGEAEVDISSDASDLRVADLSTQDAAFTSSIMDHDMKHDMTESWHEWYSEQSTAEVETQDTTFESLKQENEWCLMHQRKPPYAGHEHDPRLENFVRRLQIEKLLAEDKSTDPQLPCYLLPFKTSKDFYGRENELERLETNLHPTRATKSLRIMTLTGPAGIGKTKLAAQYCQNFQKQYDVVMWAHADEESKLANDFVEIAIQLGFIGKDLPEARDHEHCRQLVKAWLANPLKYPTNPESSEKASWLLVLDHVLHPDLINDYWPTNCKSGSILITSRKPLPWSTRYNPVIPMEPFDAKDSAAFLARLLRLGEAAGNALELGSQASHSPTQLIFLARMIVLSRYSLDEFVKASQVNDGKKAILVLHTEDATNNQTNFSEWALESLSPKAAALLDVLSMLDPDSILEQMLKMPPDSIPIMAYPKNMDEYNEARAELASFCFISRGRFIGSFNIHRLIQDAARGNMSDQYYRDTFNSCVAIISDEWPYQPFTWRHGINRWQKCEELYPHIIRLQHFSSKVNLRKENLHAHFEYARLCTDVAWYCHERGRLPESEEFCDTALNGCRVLRGWLEENSSLSKILDVAQLDRTIGEIHHNHGCMSAEMNQPKVALGHQLVFNQMMSKELKDQPGNDMRLAMSFNELGVAYMINDDYKKGEECFKQSVEEMMRLDDYKGTKVSLPLVNWASCHFLGGNYAEAEKVLLEGLSDRVEEFGPNDRESFITGRFYHGLANVKHGQGFEQESFNYLEKARDHYRTTLGRGHHRSADVMVALGRHYRRVGDNMNAVECFNKALDVYGDRSVYRPEKARVFFQRAKTRTTLGQVAEAREDEDHCLELYREIVEHDRRSFDELSDPDFDSLIVFWSR